MARELIKFECEPDGAEPYRVAATSRDIALWEASGKGRSFGQLEADMRMTSLVEIAYQASVRASLFVGTLAEFKAGVDVVPLGDDDEAETDDEAGPTRKGRSAA